MAAIRFIDAEEVRELLDAASLRSALEAALIAQSEGRTDVPPRIAASAPDGLLAAMPGFLDDGGDGLLGAKLVAVFPGNVGIPSHQGLIVHFDAATGTPLAVMDAEVITEDRTAMTAAIAADHLARADAEVLTVVGAGAQGRAHLRAFAGLRAWREVRITSRNPARAGALAVECQSWWAVPDSVTFQVEPSAAVGGADVIALCTHSAEPVIDPARVAPGAHVSSVGSQAELPVALLGAGPLVVDHLGAITSPPPAGAAELQGLDPRQATELGALLARAPGRTDDSQITVYKSTGHAVQDLAAADLVYRRAH